MRKKVLLSILVVFIFTFCACGESPTFGLSDNLALDEELYIKFNHIDDERIELLSNIFYLSNVSFLWGEEGDLKVAGGYEYLGWIGSRFWRKSHMFADSKENPTFMYSTNT